MRLVALVVIAGACGGAAHAPEPVAVTGTGLPFCDQVLASLREQPLGNYVRAGVHFSPEYCDSAGTEEAPEISCTLKVDVSTQIGRMAKCLLSTFKSRSDHDALVIEVEWPGQPKREVRVVTEGINDSASRTIFTLEPLPTVVVADTPRQYVPTPAPPPSPPDERFTKIIGKEWRGTSETQKDYGPKVLQLHELRLRIVDGDQVTGTLKSIRRIDARSYSITYTVSGELYWNRTRIRLQTYKSFDRDDLPGKDKTGWCGHKLDLKFADTFQGKPIPDGIYKLEGTSPDICGDATTQFEFVVLLGSER